MFTSELVTFIKLFENFRNEFRRNNSVLRNRINELNVPQGFYEDAAIQTEKEDLIQQLNTNEREETQVNVIIDVLTKTVALLEKQNPASLANDPDYRLLKEKLTSETFNPSYMRQVDVDQKAATIFEASNALDNLQAKLLSDMVMKTE